MQNSVKRSAVAFIFEYVEQHLDYLILRNYEGLPEDEGHDIDLLIQAKDYPRVSPLIETLKSRFGATVFLRDDYFGLYSFCLVFGNDILHLDFFTCLQWNHTAIIPTADLLQRKERFKGQFWVISKVDLSYYCWVHYVRARGHVKEKYARLAQEWENWLWTTEGKDVRNMSFSAKLRYLYKKVFLQEPLMRLACHTLLTLWCKLWKLFRMDGRIYVSDALQDPVILTCRRFCSCRQCDIRETETLTFLRCIALLHGEYSIGISTSKWESLAWRVLLPSVYVIKDGKSVADIVRNIYRNKSV